MKYTHKQNNHRSSPFRPKFFVRQLKGSFVFQEESKYWMDNEDQEDWNKLTGITFTPWQPNYDAIMIGWRYVPTIDRFQVVPYFNLEKSQWYDFSPINLKVNEFCDYEITYDYVTIGEWTTGVPVSNRYWTSMKIQPWFGGNQPAPNDVILNVW